jgi:hypothetical protein
VAEIVTELVPGAEIEIADVFGAEDRIELAYRGRLSIQSAQEQLGWAAALPLAAGIASPEYVERYRAFLEAGSR